MSMVDPMAFWKVPEPDWLRSDTGPTKSVPPTANWIAIGAPVRLSIWKLVVLMALDAPVVWVCEEPRKLTPPNVWALVCRMPTAGLVSHAGVVDADRRIAADRAENCKSACARHGERQHGAAK